jgi:hypothetical protein
MSDKKSKSKSKQPTPSTQAKKRETGELEKGKLDQVTGGYGKIETTYLPQKPDGNLDAARLA